MDNISAALAERTAALFEERLSLENELRPFLSSWIEMSKKNKRLPESSRVNAHNFYLYKVSDDAFLFASFNDIDPIVQVPFSFVDGEYPYATNQAKIARLMGELSDAERRIHDLKFQVEEHTDLARSSQEEYEAALPRIQGIKAELAVLTGKE